MSLDEFGEICAEVFEVQCDATGMRHTKIKFPEGCDTCPSELDWDCTHKDAQGNEIVCPWRLNHWKYTELRFIMMLDRLHKGRGTLAGIESLTLMDYLKLSILKDYLNG